MEAMNFVIFLGVGNPVELYFSSRRGGNILTARGVAQTVLQRSSARILRAASKEFKSQLFEAEYVRKHVINEIPAPCSDRILRSFLLMAATIIRRKAAPSELNILEEEISDNRPAYLSIFPSASSIIKDLKLGVLLGRYT